MNKNIAAAIASGIAQIDNPALAAEVRAKNQAEVVQKAVERNRVNVEHKNSAIKAQPLTELQIAELERESRYPTNKLNRGD